MRSHVTLGSRTADVSCYQIYGRTALVLGSDGADLLVQGDSARPVAGTVVDGTRTAAEIELAGCPIVLADALARRLADGLPVFEGETTFAWQTVYRFALGAAGDQQATLLARADDLQPVEVRLERPFLSGIGVLRFVTGEPACLALSTHGCHG